MHQVARVTLVPRGSVGVRKLMILIDGVKYSCLECIRGHRSTLCRHHMRALLQVRSKGRPNLDFPHGNKNYRIAVFAQNLELEEDALSPGCKGNPVVILKASDKHVIDLSNGQILGPYIEEDPNKPRQPVVKAESFVNTGLCCGGASARVRKSCECNQTKVLRLRILKTYLDKRRQAKPRQRINSRTSLPLSCCLSMQGTTQSSTSTTDLPVTTSIQSYTDLSGTANGTNIGAPSFTSYSQESNVPHFPKLEPDTPSTLSPAFPQPHIPTHHVQAPHTNQPYNNVPQGLQPAKEFEVIQLQSCSLPGTCSCSADCTCPNCVDHQNGGIGDARTHLDKSSNGNSSVDPALQFLDNDTQYHSNLILQLTQQPGQIDARTNSRFVTKESEAYFNFLAHYSAGYDAKGSYLADKLQLELDKAGETIENGYGSLCTCAEDQCFCMNCETHGIIDGYKLDEIFE